MLTIGVASELRVIIIRGYSQRDSPRTPLRRQQ